MIGCHRC